MLPWLLCAIQAAAAGQVVDRMLATVNGELILESDVNWALALDPELRALELTRENRRLMLERVIDQRILLQEARKIPQNRPTEEQITAHLNTEIIPRFASEAEFRERLRRVGLDQTSLGEIISDRLELLKYIDFRFRSFVLITPEEIERYYQEIYIPRTRNRGAEVRSLEEMRAGIESTLAEDKINSELDRFLDEARAKAEIIRLNADPTNR